MSGHLPTEESVDLAVIARFSEDCSIVIQVPVKIIGG